ncbi:MAG: prenyltransferase/squalene oxidase repeat-containing protein [Planctomycetota bacterium]|jgi:hypothetical protein
MKSALITAALMLALGAGAAAQEPQPDPAAPQPEAPQPETPEPEASEPATPPENGNNGRSAQNNPLQGEFTAALHGAVSRGFVYLKSQQNIDGSVGDRGRGRYGKHVGITSLCALAWMSDGLLAADTSHGPMYGHGFAALFLGEIYGMNRDDKRVRDALVKAVDLIIGTQNDEGGWRYNPVPYDADISVTICQIMALRSARNAGIKVPKQTIDRAVEYVHRCQNADGGFKYMLQAGGSAWPRTAGGVSSLFYAGIYHDDSITRALDYLMRNALPGRRTAGQAHYYYGHYYAVQAMYLAGGEYWEKWWPAIRDELLAKQASNGGWLDHHAGGAYATGMSLIILQMPKRYLPIFQR